MKAYTYIEKGRFELIDKPKPKLRDPKDAIVRVTLSSICSSDLHIKHGSVPRAVPGITVGHEMVGIVEEVGAEVKNVRPGFWAARISEIKEDDTVLVIGAGPTGLCTLQCVMLRNPKRSSRLLKKERSTRLLSSLTAFLFLV